MKGHYRALGGRLTVEVEGSSVKSLIAQIGPIAEILDADIGCGKCASVSIYPRCRTATKDGKSYDYYELVCSDCGAQLAFGQHMDGGTLWAKRVDKQGAPLPDRGWFIYARPEEQTAPRPAPRPNAGVATAAEREFNDRIATLLKRTGDPTATNAVHAEMCDAIEGLSTPGVASKAWLEALHKYGDPATKPDAVAPVTRALLRKIMDLEGNKLREPK